MSGEQNEGRRRVSPLWCADDSPHGEHWAYNEFNGRDYCSGRPGEPEAS